jgi:hypothetical protein
MFAINSVHIKMLNIFLFIIYYLPDFVIWLVIEYAHLNISKFLKINNLINKFNFKLKKKKGLIVFASLKEF